MIISSLIYAVRDDSILLMKRNKEPNIGLWVGPGGKREPGESPYECALRELHEETNLIAQSATFRGVITEISPRPDWQWMLFIYVTYNAQGKIISDDREGSLKWWPLADLPIGQMPEADQIFLPRIVDPAHPFIDARYVYNQDLKLIETFNHPSQEGQNHTHANNGRTQGKD